MTGIATCCNDDCFYLLIEIPIRYLSESSEVGFKRKLIHNEQFAFVIIDGDFSSEGIVIVLLCDIPSGDTSP